MTFSMETRCWPRLLLLCVSPMCAYGVLLEVNLTESDKNLNFSLTDNKAQEQTFTPLSEFSSLRGGRVPRGWDEVGSGTPEMSPDSAEKEHFLEVVTVNAATMASPLTKSTKTTQNSLLDFEDEEQTKPPWSRSEEGPMLDLDQRAVPLPSSAPAPPPQPEVLTVGYIQPVSQRWDLIPPSPDPSANEQQGADPTSWTLSDFYDYLTPEDSYSTTEVYSDEDLVATTDMLDENVPLSTTPASVPPGAGVMDKKDKDALPFPGVVDTVNGSDCRLGYVRSNGTCRSPCEMFPSFCLNGGQCYLVEGMGVFCRCNVQDYIWHKGSRCESVITEFQVMCIAVGAAALTVLLLIMITVFFGKKLHLLKTENNRLRKRSSKYRPASEQHNDNFSLSTIAEGSHPNVRKLCDTPPTVPHARALAYYDNIICQDDPNAQNKLEDPVKAPPPPSEDESLNIQNSLTPKHENHKAAGEENSSEVNSLQNNMM